ncbi:HRDC domain-containing protein [Arcanobacterium hippocoleae]
MPCFRGGWSKFDIPKRTEITPLDQPSGGIPEVINTDFFDAVKRICAGTGAFAVDTERANGIRYSNRAYLLQIKRESDEIFLIDPVGIENQFPQLAQVMQGEWILHAADQDLPCLAELGLVPEKIFDTKVAALLLGFEHVSLQALTAQILGYALAKEHSAADWSMRPLSPQMRNYAALDVELLHPLKDELTKMLRSSGRYEWFLQECEEIRLRIPPEPKKQPWRKTANRVEIEDRRALAMLENMWWVRENIAKERDIAPSRLINSTILGELARRKPRSRADVVRSPLLRRKICANSAPLYGRQLRRLGKHRKRIYRNAHILKIGKRFHI